MVWTAVHSGRTSDGIAASVISRRFAAMTLTGISGLDHVDLGLPVHVVDTEGDFGVCTGVVVELGLCGVVARLNQPLPSTCETTVQVELPDGTEVVTGAVVAEGNVDGEGWLYRLVFPSLEDAEIRAISSLLVAGGAAGRAPQAGRRPRPRPRNRASAGRLLRHCGHAGHATPSE